MMLPPPASLPPENALFLINFQFDINISPFHFVINLYFVIVLSVSSKHLPPRPATICPRQSPMASSAQTANEPKPSQSMTRERDRDAEMPPINLRSSSELQDQCRAWWCRQDALCRQLGIRRLNEEPRAIQAWQRLNSHSLTWVIGGGDLTMEDVPDKGDRQAVVDPYIENREAVAAFLSRVKSFS